MKENKTCPKCGEEKPATAEYFSRAKRLPDGLYYRCKECVKEYYQENKEAIAEQSKQYYQANREALLLKYKKYYQENKEAKSEKSRRWRQDKRQVLAEKSRRWYYDKAAEQPACVYQIVNNQNGRIYVGQSLVGELRWKDHLTMLRGNRHRNPPLQEDFNKLGEEAFVWSIIKELPKDKEVLTKEEKLHIDKMVAEGKNLYNVQLIT